MTSKALITKLQELDPEGNTHVCINNLAITEVWSELHYQNGKLQIVEQDENGTPIKGYRATSGNKILLGSYHLAELHEFNKDFKIEYHTEAHEQYRVSDEQWEHISNHIIYSVEKDGFINWVFQTIQTIRSIPISWVDLIKKAAEDFFIENVMGPDDPLPKLDIYKKCYKDWRNEWYAEKIFVDWDKYSRIIIKFKE